MTLNQLLIVPLGLFLSGCSIATIGAGIATLQGGLATIAASIDTGVAIPETDLPAACKITADVSSAARFLAQSGVLGAMGSHRLSSAADGASALATSDLCRDPSRNPLGLSLQIASAIGAVREASSGHAAVTATAIVSGPAPSNR